MHPWADVLIVDDEKNMRFFASEIFNLEGINAHAVEDGCQALDYLNDVRAKGGTIPRAMILDVMMPCMDGYQLFAEIAHQEWAANMTIIVVSASRGIDLGEGFSPVYVLYKPYEVADLLEIVRDVAPDLFNNQALR
jgi:CheY-like chemotaxis protein